MGTNSTSVKGTWMCTMALLSWHVHTSSPQNTDTWAFPLPCLVGSTGLGGCRQEEGPSTPPGNGVAHLSTAAFQECARRPSSCALSLPVLEEMRGGREGGVLHRFQPHLWPDCWRALPEILDAYPLSTPTRVDGCAGRHGWFLFNSSAARGIPPSLF